MPALPVDPTRAERKTTALLTSLMEYCRYIGLSPAALSRRSGLSPETARNLHTATLKHRRIRNFPNLLTFVKLLAAADLEIQIVRVQSGLIPDDPTEDPHTQLPSHYNTGTEGNVQWRPAP